MLVKSKLLSDTGWKDVAAKSKVKDNGLLKALEKLKRLGDDAHDEATKVLDEVGKLAGLLKKDKAVAATPAVAKYVAEVLDEAQSAARDVAKAKAEHDKTQKAKADAEKKVAAKTAEDDEDDDEELTPALLTTKLKPLLKLVAKGETMHTLVAKSGKKVVVMLSRKPISPARRKMLAEELGGGSTKYYPGICSLEGGATTFALRSEVAGMAKLMKVALLEQTGLRLSKLKCRGDDGEDADEDDEDDDVAVARSDNEEDGGTIVGAMGAAGASAAAAASACVTPEATATDCFFDYDLADLTPSDKTFLEAYAKAYIGSKTAEKIVVEGYASKEGFKPKNETLAVKRAAQVANYLVARGVPRKQLEFFGRGPTTQFSSSNLCLNRRATLRPQLDLKVRDFVDVVESDLRNVPVPGKTPKPTLGEKAEMKEDFTLPEPPEMVSREVVRKALEDWLLDLGKAQNIKAREADVHSTSRVYVAEQTLLGRTRGGEEVDRPAVTPENGDGRDWRAKALADHIANNLPEEIPKVNFDLFRKMSAREVRPEKSTADQIRDKFDEEADRVLGDLKIPEKYRKDIKDAIRKRIPDLIDKLPIDDDVKAAAKKAYEKLNKSDKSE